MNISARLVATILLIGCCLGALPAQAQRVVGLGSGFSFPAGVAVGSSGNVFVADPINNTVQVILAASGYVTVDTLGSGFSGPQGVAVDSSGNVFVADTGNNAVEEILAAGGYTIVKTLGSGFSGPQGVALDASGNVFVADTGNNAVEEILAAGNYVTVKPLGNGFAAPGGVAVDGSGNVFVADTGNNAVKEIPAAGGYTTIKMLGSGFSSPDGVAVDGNGNVFVADTVNRAVEEILAAGNYATVDTIRSGLSQVEGVAVDGSGNIFIADSDNHLVREILAADGYAPVKPLGSGFFEPGGVAVDSAGNVFVADNQNNAVEEILAAGGYTTVNAIGSGFSHPGGVALDGSGNVFVADTGNNAVEEILAAGDYTTTIPIGSGFAAPEGVALDSNGNVFVTDSQNHAIKEILVAGGYTTVSTLVPQFNFPTGIAVDSSGNVFVADSFNSAVFEIAATGGYATSKTLGIGIVEPWGLAVDGKGNLFVSDATLNVVYEILAVGGSIPAFPAVSTIGTGFDTPLGIAIDGSGNVFVADSNHEAVSEILAVTATRAVASTSLTVDHAAAAFVPVIGSSYVLPFAYSVAPGLPTGLNLDPATGAVTGNPSVTSLATTYIVTVTDADSVTAAASFDLTVNAALAATPAFASTGLTVDQAALLIPVIGSGGTTPLGYSVSPPLPTGLSLAPSTGTVTGTPTVTSSAASYAVTVTDANGATAMASFSLSVNGTITASQAVPSTSLTLNHAAAAFAPVTGSGGTAPLGYSVSPLLPTGLSMASGTGTISGTASVASAARTYTVTVTDANGATAMAGFSLTVNGAVAAIPAIASTRLTVNQAATSFTPVTGAGGTGGLTYSVAPTLPIGLAMKADTGAVIGSPGISSPATSYTVTVTDADNATAMASFSLIVGTAASTTTLASALNPSTLGQSVTLIVTVSGPGTVPTGSVTFMDGATPLGSATLSGGTAHLVTAVLAVASHPITATYGGDTLFSAGTSSTLTQTVDPAVTATTLLSSIDPSAPGQPVTFSSVVTSAGGDPTGQVMFRDGASLLGTGSLTAGIASFTTATLSTSSHSITAAYAGSGNFAPSTSPALGQTVTTATNKSTITATSSLNPSAPGQSVTLTATVTGTGGTPSGTVTFTDGATLLGSVQLAAGAAGLGTADLGAGSHSIVAVYAGDATFLASSTGLIQTVDAAATGTGQVYRYQSTLGVAGTAGSENTRFNSPAAGAVDTIGGHLFVADSGNQRVQAFDSGTLALVETIGVAGVSGSDNGHFTQPSAVGIDAATGRLFVADSGNQRIQVFDAGSFAYVATLGTTGVAGSDNAHFDAPVSSHVNPVTHQLYVADSGNNRVQIFDAGTLAYVATLGTLVAGRDNAHFDQPHDAEANPSAHQIMVADSANGRVQLFDATSLAYVATLGGPGLDQADNLYLGSPVTAAFDPTTNLVLIADDGSDDRVQGLDAMTYGYVLTLGTTGSAGPGNGQFAGPLGVAIDPVHARIFVGDPQNDRIQAFSIAPPVIFAAALPGSRSVLLGTPATIFASMINAGSTTLANCRVALPVAAPAGLTLDYQTTDPATNALAGAPDTAVPIAGNNAVQSFLVSLRGTAAFSAPGMALDFDCDGAAPAAIDIGVDTVDLVLSTTPVADIIALAATPSSNGIVAIPEGGAAAFAVASTNVGVTAPIIVSVDTGTATLPVAATICQSNPSSGQCLAPPSPSVSLGFAAGATPTFSVFLQASGAISFAPAASRVFLRFKDAGGGLHGSTSVAIETE
jgi:DNA-binding beta-propeller fold protein YncE